MNGIFQIQVVCNDITEEIGTIVNAANSELDHGGGVAAAISDKGGYIIDN